MFKVLLFILCLLTFSQTNAQNKKISNKDSATSKQTSTTIVTDSNSKKVQYKDKTEINFEDTLIEGSVKNPFASMINSRDSDVNTGFIKIRKNWHDMLIMSVSGIR